MLGNIAGGGDGTVGEIQVRKSLHIMVIEWALPVFWFFILFFSFLLLEAYLQKTISIDFLDCRFKLGILNAEKQCTTGTDLNVAGKRRKEAD
jgi:uncharacterized membrane protein